MAKLSDCKFKFFTSNESLRRFIFWFAAALATDQGLKYLAKVLGWLIFLNPGISLGWFEWVSATQMVLVVLLVSLILGVGLRDYWQNHPSVSGLLFGAVASNIVDRVLFGAVVDWLNLPLLNLHNNLADILVVGILFFKVIPDLIFNKKSINQQ